MAEDLDAHIEQFRTRRLDDAGPFTFLAADALVLKVHDGDRMMCRKSYTVSSPHRRRPGNTICFASAGGTPLVRASPSMTRHSDAA